MLKRTRNTSEDIIEEVSTGVGLSGKLSGIGTKMEKIFRAAFRKDLSQSTQELNADVDNNLQRMEDKSDSKDINNRKKLVRGKMKRTKALGSSDWSSDVDFGSKKNLVEENKITDDEIHEIIDKNDSSNSKNNIKKSGKKLRKLKRSERIRSNELESNSDVVVVDIHRENISKSPKKIEQTVIDVTEFEDNEIEQEVIHHSNSNQKSLDITQDSLVDSMRKQRKRWSKDANIVIPRKESTSSSSVSDKSNSWVKKSSGTTTATKPVPAPRLNKIIIEESSLRDHKKLGQDNQGFESDHDYVEQVLTIETEFGVVEKTKIEMNSADSECEEIEEIEEIETEQVIKSVERLADISDIEEINQETVVQKIKISDRERDSESQTKNSSSSSRENEKRAKHLRQKNQSAEDSTSSDIQKISEVATAIKEDKKYKKKIRERSKSKSKSSSSRSQSGTVSSQSVDVKPPHRKNRKTRKKEDVEHDFKFVSITIHRADMLVADYMTKHPMVIVHIVEESTGNYLKTGKESKNHLQPLMTGTFDFRENKSMIPCWEEELIFEHDFDSIVNQDNKTLILFEIVDLPSFADASYTYDHFGGENCWYKIAWGFLKPVGRNGVAHIEKFVRLQLYKPKKNSRRSIRHKCEPYSWWKSGSRDKYPSTLFVTVTSVEPPKLEPVFYSQLTLDELSDEQTEPAKSIPHTEMINVSRWSRLAAQSCKIPNELFLKTEVSDNGCFYVCFSNNGKYLACVNCEEYDYPITVWKIDDEKIFVKFSGHKSFIYALDWSKTDNHLLSVSSDQTARVWDVENKLINEINMLPHPSYVYCGKFEPSNPQTIITGCYDRVSRVWSRKNKNNNYELSQELEGHDGFVNSICFLNDGGLLTADSVGIIIHWSVKKKKGSSRDWQISRKIKIREIVNVAINTIVLHPLGSRLLVHSRDNGLRMLDLATAVVLQRYSGLKNSRVQTTARISPCGSLILCGGEDATLNIWNTDSGKHIAIYQTNLVDAIVTGVDYHPYDHALVYSIFGFATEACILRFNKQSTGESVGLKLLDTNYEKNVNDTEVKLINSSARLSTQRLSHRKSYDSMKLESKENLGIMNSDSREDLRSRLKLFNDSEQQLKSRSTNRLSSIIAKIDKILSNSNSHSAVTRTLYDIEANRTEDLGLESPHYSDYHNPNHHQEKVMPYVPPLFSTLEDNSTSGSRSETFEMIDLHNSRRHSGKKNVKKIKSKSARSQTRHSLTHHDDDIDNKTMSDGAAYNRRLKTVSEKVETRSWTNIRVKDLKGNRNRDEDKDSNDVELGQGICRDERHESSPESGGTYVVDKNDDVNIESESSVRSDVTFVIESEKPVPKPRKKRARKQNV
ncbi:jouberin-like [Microplitis mediator]|uniref:jouberin-like n=1 Tax=Microplitis mediator TaxID=375433 RepID=UPI002553223B|nr:jouberin-like [Microplitis mediator]